MNDDQLLRYARHLLLPDIDLSGQEALLRAHVLIVGAGGLGSPAAMYLAASGVGALTVADPDVVEPSNLQRQIAHPHSRIGQSKVASMQQTLAALNPDTRIHATAQRADAHWLHTHVPQADVVLDCSDNFATRQAINRACVAHGKPLVWGAALRFEGQLGVYQPALAHSPCYACLFDPAEPPPAPDCATLGVFAPLVGIIGSIQAAEAAKLLCGISSHLTSQMLLVHTQRMAFTPVAAMRRANCPVCKAHEHMVSC